MRKKGKGNKHGKDTSMTVIQFTQKRARKEKLLSLKIAADIEELKELQSRVNASMGERQRATKEQALIAKLKTNLESQLKFAKRLETLKTVEADLNTELANLNDAKKKAEKAVEAKAKKAERARKEKDFLKAIDKSGLSIKDVKERLGL